MDETTLRRDSWETVPVRSDQPDANSNLVSAACGSIHFCPGRWKLVAAAKVRQD